MKRCTLKILRRGFSFMCFATLGLIAGGNAGGQLAPARKIVKRVEAQYPAILKSRSIGGTVRLKVLVKADGSVKSMEVTGGNAILAAAAQNAVMQWKFAPDVSETTVDVSVVFDPKS
jgi:TonB family protein